MILMFDRTSTFEFEFLRTLSHTCYGGADIGECFETGRRIVDGDPTSWYVEWTRTGDRVAVLAERSEAGGHIVSARDAWLRASNYHRAADFFLDGTVADHRIDRARTASTHCFRTAARLMDPPAEPIRLPFADTTLPAYFITQDAAATPRPTVVIHNGFDGTGDECYFIGGRAAVERGYNVLLFEGPGQGAVLHATGLPFRPDWETVVRPALDYLTARPDVDASRIGLIGISMGGLLAPRAAAFEPRISAVVAFNGVYDMFDFALDLVPLPRSEARARLLADTDAHLDRLLDEVIEQSPLARWSTDHGRWAFDTPTPRRFLAALHDYHLRDGIAERIACPVLVLKSEVDFAFSGQPEQLYRHLTCRRTLVGFTRAAGAGEHCQFGSMTHACARVFDWLDDMFRNSP